MRILILIANYCSVFFFLSFSGCIVLLPFVESDQDSCSLEPGVIGRSCEKNALYNYNSNAVNQKNSASYYPKTNNPNTADKGKKQQLAYLMKKLQSKNSADRTNAASDLGAMGYAAYPSLDALKHVLKHDQCKWARRAAAKALPRISTEKTVIDSLRDALNDRNKWVAHSAAGSLRKIGTPEALAALKKRNS